ncbi:MAG: nucleotidyltransferase family protein [Clostridia bacterium]|nr:nucleotidyltransferase family protein [Clostridia bacterium]
MNETVRIMFALLRFVLKGEPSGIKSLTEEEGKALYALSKKHDMAHLLGYSIEKEKIEVPENIKNAFRKQKMTAVYRSSIMEEEYKKITELFEAEGIEYIPLKGAVIRNYYPESWMRTSCDIDILVKEEKLEKARTALIEKLSYSTEEKVNYHDISMYSGNGVHLELHFSIKESMENIDRLLSLSWDYAEKDAGTRFAFKKEFFMFHLISHMSYHFVGGGCGIRQFIDLYLLRGKLEFEENILREYLGLCKIEKFYDEVIRLSDIWLGNTEHTALTHKMEEFIINGGVYGNETQHIAIKQKQNGGKAGYILRRLFMPKKSLEILFPSLKKHPFLYPFFTVARWTKLLKMDVKMRVEREISINSNIAEEDSDEVSLLLSELGI